MNAPHACSRARMRACRRPSRRSRSAPSLPLISPPSLCLPGAQGPEDQERVAPAILATWQVRPPLPAQAARRPPQAAAPRRSRACAARAGLPAPCSAADLLTFRPAPPSLLVAPASLLRLPQTAEDAFMACDSARQGYIVKEELLRQLHEVSWWVGGRRHRAQLGSAAAAGLSQCRAGGAGPDGAAPRLPPRAEEHRQPGAHQQRAALHGRRPLRGGVCRAAALC